MRAILSKFLKAVVVWAAVTSLVNVAQAQRALANLSLQAQVSGSATGAGVLAASFTVEDASRDVLVRAVGPTLGLFGVAGARVR